MDGVRSWWWKFILMNPIGWIGLRALFSVVGILYDTPYSLRADEARCKKQLAKIYHDDAIEE